MKKSILSLVIGLLLIGMVSLVQAQVCAPEPASVISWWSGDDDSADEKGPHHGQLKNGAKAGIPGKVGGAFELDGLDDYVEMADAPGLDVRDGITLMAWIKPTKPLNTYIGEPNIIASKYSFELKEMAYALFAIRDRVGFALSRDGSSSTFAFIDTSTYAIAVGEWTHIAGQWENGIARIFVNGEEVISGKFQGPIFDSPQPFRIGTRMERNGLRNFFPGLIDEVELYGHALSAEEIKAVITASSAGHCKDNRSVDADGDGYDETVDCNDDNAAVYPGAPEVRCNGFDEDCDGLDSYGTDEDKDGYYVEGELCGEIDCDDGNPTVNQGATELACDNVDNNCNGLVDESNSAPVVRFDIISLEKEVVPVGKYASASLYRVEYEVLDECGTESESLMLSACNQNTRIARGDVVLVSSKAGKAEGKQGNAFACTLSKATVDTVSVGQGEGTAKESMTVWEVANGEALLSASVTDDHGLSSTTSYEARADGTIAPIGHQITGQTIGAARSQNVVVVVAIVAIISIVAMTYSTMNKKRR